MVRGDAEQEHPPTPDVGIDDGQRLPPLVQQLGRDQQRPHTRHSEEPDLGQVHRRHPGGHRRTQDPGEPVDVAGIDFAAHPQPVTHHGGRPGLVVDVAAVQPQHLLVANPP